MQIHHKINHNMECPICKTAMQNKSMMQLNEQINLKVRLFHHIVVLIVGIILQLKERIKNEN